MLIHESYVLELQVETKFEVNDPRNFVLSLLMLYRGRPEKFRPDLVLPDFCTNHLRVHPQVVVSLLITFERPTFS